MLEIDDSDNMYSKRLVGMDTNAEIVSKDQMEVLLNIADGYLSCNIMDSKPLSGLLGI